MKFSTSEQQLFLVLCSSGSGGSSSRMQALGADGGAAGVVCSRIELGRTKRS